MLYHKTASSEITGYCVARRRTLFRKVLFRCMDLLQHLLLLGVFLLFISFVQVATANELNAEKFGNGYLQFRYESSHGENSKRSELLNETYQ